MALDQHGVKSFTEGEKWYSAGFNLQPSLALAMGLLKMSICFCLTSRDLTQEKNMLYNILVDATGSCLLVRAKDNPSGLGHKFEISIN